MKALLILPELYAPLIEMKLLAAHYEVDWAKDGYEGVERLKQSSYDVVVTGYILPFYNGLEIVDLLKNKLHVSYNPKTFMLSHVHTPQLIQNATDLGVNKFHTSPIDLEELMHDINHQIEAK